MSLRVAVQMDPMAGVNINGDSSFALMLAAQARGFDVWHYDVGTLNLDANDRLTAFAKGAEGEGFKVIIAGAGGAAHLPGMVASMTHLPVLGVPVQSKALSGQDSLLSIVQMPAGIPVGTLAIGEAGATNAGLLAALFQSGISPNARDAAGNPLLVRAANVGF